jgi:hypothetical protein
LAGIDFPSSDSGRAAVRRSGARCTAECDWSKKRNGGVSRSLNRVVDPISGQVWAHAHPLGATHVLIAPRPDADAVAARDDAARDRAVVEEAATWLLG